MMRLFLVGVVLIGVALLVQGGTFWESFPLLISVALPHSSRAMGVYVLGARGVGKSRLLGRVICWQDYIAGIPQVVFDPMGQTIDNFLDKLVRFLEHVPKSQHRQYWDRVVYVNIQEGRVGFPLYYRIGTESLREIADRYVQTLALAEPALLDAPVRGLPPLRKTATYTGIALAALNLQVTSAPQLLRHPRDFLPQLEHLQGSRLDLRETVSFFRDEYIPMRQTSRERLTDAFLDRVFPFRLDSRLHSMFSAQVPGIHFDEVARSGTILLLDYRDVSDPELQRFLLLWGWKYLFEWIKRRGRSEQPFAITIDEFQALTNPGVTGPNPLVSELDTFINSYMRNYTIWFTAAHQELFQLADERLRQTMLSLGTYIIGRQSNPEACRVLADHLFQSDVFRVKHWRKVWGKVDPPPYWARYTTDYRDYLNDAHLLSPHYPYYVLDTEPEFMRIQEQIELAGNRIRDLDRYQFLVRPATAEGSVSPSVIPVSIANVDWDKETGEYLFPRADVVARVRAILAQKGGTPSAAGTSDVPAVRKAKEQEAQLIPGTRKELGMAKALPPGEVAATPRTVTQRPPRKAAPPPPERTSDVQTTTVQLDEEQQAFLRFISEHPDTPVSLVYKALSLSWYKGNQLREHLMAQGLITELDGRSKAGRKTLVCIPTLQTFELLGIEPPTGRGSALHRYLQQRVVQGAKDKGYRTHVEKDVGNGGIVDVHLERDGGVRIAVEIAVVSTVERELAHIRQCLDAGYHVYTVFLDDHLMARTQAALATALEASEVGKVRLVPVSKLSHIG